MPQQLITIPIDASTPEMAPAAFLATLAYPGTADSDKRGAFLMALRADYFAFLAHDSDRRWQSRAIEPALLEISKAKLGRARGNGIRLIRDYRLTAARMAATILHHDAAGVRLSVNKVAESVAGDLGDVDGGNTTNILHRQWGTSRPALHLGLALRDVIINRGGIDGDYPIHDLLDRPEWIEQAVPAAEIIRQHLVTSPLFRGVVDNKSVKIETRLVSSSL